MDGAKELFLKNTAALFEVDQVLAYKLRSLENFSSFSIDKEANFIRHDNDKIYENVDEELKTSLELFKNDFYKYPVLFFYGFGNGKLYKILCENKNHKAIVVFEDELEILALAFHLFDFSKEIKSEKLILFYTKDLNLASLNALFSFEFIKKSIKIYNLHIHSSFYAKHYYDKIESLNKDLMEIIRFVVLNHGNDPIDSMTGIEHTLNNIPKMLNHGIFQEFLKSRRAKLENAILVSTGPSLTKQLPLLKEYQNKVAIFCADSAYSILAKENIKPDYVCMLERDEIVSECFNNDFGDFDKDILFILASVVSKKTIDYLEKNYRRYILVHRPLNSAGSLKLDEYGYLGVGMSVANMIYELIGALRFKNIILIGQDLAYAKDGVTHAKGHIYGEKGEELRDNLYTLAYGGKGEVRTQLSWQLFRQHFEKDIFFTKTKLGITTYNCTEGGARIEESIEKPFKEVCEELLNEDLCKPFEFPKSLSLDKMKEKLKKTKKNLEKNVNESENYIKKCKNELKKLDYEFKKEQKNLQTLRKIKDNLLQFFKELKTLKLFNELSQAMYFHNECEVMKYEVLNSLKQDEKLLDFLSSQNLWFLQILDYLKAQNETINKAIKEWEI
ncbi:motility associated factor glycosyltransferase family protein [Campylobacter sp. TTU-622]|uniref:motility associated factor glycosyltransferase family protein n=1 Tax=Campylobacter sp. TTU-622 TaxID=2800583 RepID=UPI0019042D94|nr:motility associated factor glycosyltransferase family protein [Campylobacter sp. TTU-622]MBK1973935.1 motility associated factor glycosyltransferase family protein [Campylobacter sp. TTU-622]